VKTSSSHDDATVRGRVTGARDDMQRTHTGTYAATPGVDDTTQTLGLLQAQLRAQAREIARLQRQCVELNRERDALRGKVLKPLNERFADNVRDLIKDTCWFKLRQVEEVIDVNTYESTTRAEFDLAGASSRLDARFPDLKSAKITTTENIGPFGIELKSRPFRGELLQFKAKVDLERLLNIARAPTLVLSPSPIFPWNRKTKWNPALETHMDVDGVAVSAKYTIVNDSVSMDHLDFDVSTTHEEYGSLSLSRVSQHTVQEDQLDVNPDGCWRAGWSQRKGDFDLSAHFKTDKNIELELSARRQFAKHFNGKVTAKVAAKELEFQAGYEFTEELKGWEVIAKSVLTPQGLLHNPTFQLNHAWEF